MTTRPKANDLFITTLHELHSEAPVELLNSLRAQLKQIKSTNPNSAQTAEACLEGLASDQSSLLHVLTAAYLINGGVMIKHQAAEEERPDLSTDFDSLEEELNRFSITMDGNLKPRGQAAQSPPPPHPERSADTLGDPAARG